MRLRQINYVADNELLRNTNSRINKTCINANPDVISMNCWNYMFVYVKKIQAQYTCIYFVAINPCSLHIHFKPDRSEILSLNRYPKALM